MDVSKSTFKIGFRETFRATLEALERETAANVRVHRPREGAKASTETGQGASRREQLRQSCGSMATDGEDAIDPKKGVVHPDFKDATVPGPVLRRP